MGQWLTASARIALGGFWMLAAAAMANAAPITIYTALEEDEIADYVAQAKKDLAGVEFNVLRLSTGDLGARILAESANPQHDVIWGWAVTNMLDPRVLALTEPYAAKGSESLGAAYKDGEG
jgi:iron(III) transport system substrate-binding protein